mmetsp:Transcript_21256/g.42439  ORF Transcript_21256/g.42439 Transcript_21256/m.42439 type:complete len:248 (-) Transcript_21256:1201-1944(-)
MGTPGMGGNMNMRMPTMTMMNVTLDRSMLLTSTLSQARNRYVNLVIKTVIVWIQSPMISPFCSTLVHLQPLTLSNCAVAVLVSQSFLSPSPILGTPSIVFKPLLLTNWVRNDRHAYNPATGMHKRIANALNQSPWVLKYFLRVSVKGLRSLSSADFLLCTNMNMTAVLSPQKSRNATKALVTAALEADMEAAHQRPKTSIIMRREKPWGAPSISSIFTYMAMWLRKNKYRLTKKGIDQIRNASRHVS